MVTKKAKARRTGPGALPAPAPSEVRWVPLDEAAPWDRNPRANDGRPVEKVAASIKRFGFIVPVVVWTSRARLVTGHTRLKALRVLLAADPAFVPRGAPGPGLVLVRFYEFADEAEANAYAIADNRLGEEAEWDYASLAGVLKELGEVSADTLAITGFDAHELEPMLRADWSPEVVDPAASPLAGSKPEAVSAPSARTVVFSPEQWEQVCAAVDYARKGAPELDAAAALARLCGEYAGAAP